MNASFGFDVSKLKTSDDVLVLSAETGTLGNDTLLTKAEKTKLGQLRTKAPAMVRNAGSFLDEVAEQIVAKDQLTIGPRLKIFLMLMSVRGKLFLRLIFSIENLQSILRLSVRRQ